MDFVFLQNTIVDYGTNTMMTFKSSGASEYGYPSVKFKLDTLGVNAQTVVESFLTFAVASGFDRETMIDAIEEVAHLHRELYGESE